MFSTSKNANSISVLSTIPNELEVMSHPELQSNQQLHIKALLMYCELHFRERNLFLYSSHKSQIFYFKIHLIKITHTFTYFTCVEYLQVLFSSI